MSEGAEKSCAVCQSTDGLENCPSCQTVCYCCKEHQAQHWKEHKPNCVKQENVGDISKAMEALEVSLATENVMQHDNPSNHVAEEHAVDRNLPRDLPSHITHSWIVKVASDIVSCLEKFGIAVVNKFLGAELGNKILDEAILLHDRHLMTDGQTIVPSSSSESVPQKKYRLDKISWVDGVEPDCQNIGVLVTLMDTIMQHAQEKLTKYNIKGRTKAMVACYPGRGSNYMKHVDNPMQDGRLLTCIYYLNNNWNCKADGGMLKLYPQGCTRIASIEPIMDRLIVFWSDTRNPHEVLPSYKTRFAVTTWYFDADERRRAMSKQSQKKEQV